MNEFIGEGNLGQEPDVRVVSSDGEDSHVANLRVYFDRSVPNAKGKLQGKKGFWLNVEVWGDRAKQVARLCSKGSRVAVIGFLIDDSYETDSGTVAAVAVRARRIYLAPTARMESVRYRTDTAA